MDKLPLHIPFAGRRAFVAGVTLLILGVIIFVSYFRVPSLTPRPEPPRYPAVEADLSATDAAVTKLQEDFARTKPAPADRKWVLAKLSHMRETDVLLRGKFNLPFEKSYSEDETKFYMRKFDRQLQALDKTNAADLKPLLKRYGWFKVSEWGKDADTDAWLIVQHSDEDVAFQKAVLAKLTALYPAKETEPANFALLSDRVAVHEKRPQKYATQGGCTAPGRWEPDPFEEPLQVDARRRLVGLAPLEEYKIESGRGCH